MSKQTEEQLIGHLAAVMTMAEAMLEQLGVMARLYDSMPDDVKKKVAAHQVRQRIERSKA